MDCKLCKSEDLNEKEHENSIGDHRLARLKEQEVKTKLGRISRDNGPKMGEKSAYDEREKQIIDKRLSEFTERDKNKRSAKTPINGIQRERHLISIPRSRWDPELQLVLPNSSYLKNKENSSFRDSLWGAVETEDHYTTYPLVQVLSHYIHSSASPPPDHLDDFNPDSQQQQQIYNPSPDIENNSPHFLVLSPSIPPSAPVHQDLGDLNPNNQQQQHINFTPSDIENDVFDEDLPPNSILAQQENPVPPPPDYLE